MYDVITFGSATRDVFLKVKNLRVFDDKKSITGKNICLPIDSKIEVEEINIFSGGGGTNTAATFAKQNLKTAYYGMVGDDLAGREIIDELEDLGVDTRFVLNKKGKSTNCSVFISSSINKRTILVYRGASNFLLKKDINQAKLKAKWFYLAPFSGQNIKLFYDLIDFAFRNKIKVALNPSMAQLSLPETILKKTLQKVDVLLLNREEASFLAKIPFQKEKEIFQKIDQFCPGILIMTKGGEGAVISDDKYLYRLNTIKISKRIDPTGAGDAFGSGFVAGLIKTGNIEYAAQLAMANSGNCVKTWGAKQGLFKAEQAFPKVRVFKTKQEI
ncbi:MAG: carbohydrate kinase family protein [bacterium]